MTATGRAPSRRYVVTIVGPTAVGKTAVALSVADAVGGEIISADSRQVYRWMDVGTAKPTAEERARAPHHLIDVADPSETYDAARFASDAEDVIADILERRREPLVVGGTGFYIASLYGGLFEGPGRDEGIREELTARADREGTLELHAELGTVDPEAARRIHPNDTARVVRALEVYLSSGRTLTEWQSERPREPVYRGRFFGLTMPRDLLYERIDSRVDSMVEKGLPQEIRRLVAEGKLTADMPAASAVGYRELLPFLDGDDDDLRTAVRLVKRNSRRYAKRQMTWFSSIEDIRWLDVSSGHATAAAEIVSALGESP
jgi:tRNA dimethylallyltransferase